MTENTDQNLDYALQAIQDIHVRESEEFILWLSVPENKELFMELMACREALMREKVLILEKQEVKRRAKSRMRMLVGISAAAILVLVFLIPSLLPEVPRQTEPVRFFAANGNAGHVILQTDGQGEQLLEESVMDVKEWKTLPLADTVCCQTLTTPRGKDFLLVLADGTKVWLNAESSLRYPVAFDGKQRRVELKGEACFEVAKNTACPFIVCADGMDTRVLGTKFNVRSYTSSDRHVTLVNGKVQVTNTANQSSVLLQPGQDLTYTATGEEKISNVNIATYTAWTEGMFYFEDTKLKDIMSAMGRWYNVNIDFAQAELYDIRLNFWANRNAGLNEALALLNKLHKVRADYQDGTIIIKHV